MAEKQKQSRYVMEIIEKSKRIYGKKKFVYYAIANGIKEILNKGTKGIMDLLFPRNIANTGQIDILAEFC